LSGALDLDSVFEDADQRHTTILFQKENYERAIRIVEELKRLCQRLGVTLPVLAVSWLLHQEGVTSALVGARTVPEIVEDSCAADLEITEEDVGLMGKLSDQFVKELPGYDSYWG